MKAALRLRTRIVLPDDSVVEIVLWKPPQPSPERPHDLKYRLYRGHHGKCLARYDNEIDKGDHVHYGDREAPYRFQNWDRLLENFLADGQRLTGGEDEEA